MKYKFAYYFKFEFIFKGEDDSTIYVGGNSDDIYRANVYPEMSIEDIKREFGEEELIIIPKKSL